MGICCRTIVRTFVITILIVFFLATFSCNSANNIESAEEGVARFHSQLDAEQYHTIYVESDQAFHKGGSEAEFLTLAQAIHRKLGRVQNSTLKASKTQWVAGTGTIVTLIYDTQFTQGRGTEKFIWRVTSNRAILVGYYVNSNDLLVK